MSGKREAKLLSKKSPEENGQEEEDDDDEDDVDYVPEKEVDEEDDEKSGDDEDDQLNEDESVNNKRKFDEQEAEKSEQVKQKEADIWSSFLKDVGGIKKTLSPAETIQSSSNKSSSNGSQVKEPATKNNFFSESSSKVETKLEATTTKTTQEPEKKKVKTGGLAGLLNKLDKKTTESTLSKSKLDWDEFKKAEDIEEDLTIHSKGKTSYLDRQAFLERVDYRQFELERSHRDRNRTKKD